MGAVPLGRPDTRFRRALLIALAVHLALLLGLSFRPPDTERYAAPQIDVTLARKPSDRAPRDARHRAQANQLGSGNASQRDALTRRSEPTAGLPATATAANPAERADATRDRRQESVSTNAETRARLLQQSEAATAPSLPRGLVPQGAVDDRGPEQTEGDLAPRTQREARGERVRRVLATAANSSVDAAYLQDWRRRVETVGNRYYPEASIRYGIYGSLRLLVVVDHTGRLENIQVLSSSGYALLDEAAIKIVRMAAPYAPFPPELRATTDKLEIVRTWQFRENRLSSG